MLRMCRGGRHADAEEAFRRIFTGNDDDGGKEHVAFEHKGNAAAFGFIGIRETEFKTHALRFE